MSNYFDRAATKILVNGFDPLLDSYLDIFLDNSSTKEAGKKGLYKLMGLKNMLIVFTLVGAAVDSDEFDKQLNITLDHIDGSLIEFKNEFEADRDIEALIIRLQDLMEYITRYQFKYLPKEIDKPKNKKPQGAWWDSNYWQGLN